MSMTFGQIEIGKVYIESGISYLVLEKDEYTREIRVSILDGSNCQVWLAHLYNHFIEAPVTPMPEINDQTSASRGQGMSFDDIKKACVELNKLYSEEIKRVNDKYELRMSQLRERCPHEYKTISTELILGTMYYNECQYCGDTKDFKSDYETRLIK